MNSVSNKLRFGVSYCPYAKSGDVDMSVWDRDFKTMKELHFNAVRCFVAWDRIEIEEGQFDFSKVDRIFELAEKYEMDVLLNVGGVFATFGGIYPPRWLIRDYHCQEVVKDPQHPETSFGPHKLLCTDDDLYQSKAEAFTVRMVKRYANQKSLFGWNVWNEAYLQPQCYCPRTLAKFRNWLKAKYNDNLDALNTIWGTEFPVCYRKWEEIEPGLGTGFLASGFVARLDWLHFNQDRVASWVDRVNDLVHEHDRLKRPTSSNIVTTAVYGDVSWHGIPDLWSQARHLDITGFSFYSDIEREGRVSALNSGLSSVRGSSNDPAKGFWVLETEAGQVYNPTACPPEVADGLRRESTHWLSVLHGAKAILLWKFGGRATDTQTDTFNLTAWDGSITERAKLNAKVAETFLSNEKLFLNRTYQSKVAVLHSSDNALYTHVANLFREWQLARYGASRVFRDLHIPTDCVSDVQVREEGILSKYKVLVVPCALSLDKLLADAIADFIRKGGVVIADQRFGIFNENAVNQLQAPGQGLRKLFGAYINDFLLGAESTDVSLSDGGSLTVNGNYRSILHVQDKNCQILGAWPDKSTAIISRQVEKGQVLWFGYQPFRDYELKPSVDFSTFLGKALQKHGITSDYEITGLSPKDEVEIGALSDDNGTKTHFLINLSPRDLVFMLRVKSAQGALRDILSENSYDFSAGACEILLPAWQTRILA